MYAPRRTVGVAVLVTVILVVSSMGIIGALVPAQAAGSATPGSPKTVASSATAPTTLSGANGNGVTNLATGARTLPTPTVPTPSASDSSRSAQILSAINQKGISDHDVFLPYLLNGPHPALTNGHVNLTYQSSPAPYGIGEFGLENVSGVITPYTLSTTSVEGNFSTDYLSGYSADISGPDEWGVQLNAVLNGVKVLGQTGDQFWTQNVIEYSPSLGTLTFVSNIWNFSAYGASLTCNVFYATNGTNVCPEYFYGVSAPIPTTFPFAVNLYLNSSVEGGRDAVYFNYTLDQASGFTAGSYCYAIFNSLPAGANPSSTPTPMFVATGNAYNAYGLPDDFEITLGGPGGGSNFDVMESAWTYMGLQYWNSTDGTYLTVPSAYNVGGDTGETSVGVNAAWTQFTSDPGAPVESPTTCADCVTLSNGPSFQYGLWNVLGAGVNGYSPYAETDWDDQSDLAPVLFPANAFLFIADSLDDFTTWEGTNFSAYQWAPDFAPYFFYDNLPVGNYTVIAILADFDPAEFSFTIASDSSYETATIGLSVDTTTGVYTPLWAFNETGLQNITSGYDGYGDAILDNNEYAPIGVIPFSSIVGYANIPLFGLFNDFAFPVFPGILVVDQEFVAVVNAPAFTVSPAPYPSYDSNIVQGLGLPTTNSLQMFFWDDYYVLLESSTVSGWWPAESYFGLSQSLANVQFWNTSESEILYNTFETGGMALWMYGGEDNEIWGNTFSTEGNPPSANPYATVAEYYGSVGLVDSDFGDAYLYGADASVNCLYCDSIANNAFNTIVTADSPETDPYTGFSPILPFSSAWNIPYEAGMTNIVGGDYLGGNYWWDYGTGVNPYGVLPDIEFNWLPYDEEIGEPSTICETNSGNCYAGSGDFYPLVNVALYNLTFEETGLPSGQTWGVYVLVPSEYEFEYEDEENSSLSPGIVNFTFPTGAWEYSVFTDDSHFAAVGGVATISDQSLVVTVHFQTAYAVQVVETGLPAGTDWYGYFENDSNDIERGNSSSSTTFDLTGLLPGTYYEYMEAEGAAYSRYIAAPNNINFVVTGSGTFHVTFVASYTVSVHVSGLASGATWYFQASGVSGNISLYDEGNGWENYTVGAGAFVWQTDAAGYAASPSSGSLTISANTTIAIVFTPTASATGTLSGTVSPAAATLWVDGQAVTLGAGGTYAVVVPIGVTSVEVKDGGYATYFNNATVSLGQTTTLNIALTPVTSSSSSSGTSGISSLGWALIALLGALAVIFLVTTLIFARRGRTPPSMQPYTAPPPAASGGAGAPPSGASAPAPPPWQESPPSPPAGGSS
ncbi:MAG TPA: thermopsin family protease [Thermoplasmata archaeon]|nr:thermopsin family protease [Thermoplasmata archaeon]